MVIIPTYITLCEEICETSISMDTDKDGDEAIKELEVKFLYTNDVVYTYKTKTTQIKLPYIHKVYTSISKKQECPPPEVLS